MHAYIIHIYISYTLHWWSKVYVYVCDAMPLYRRHLFNRFFSFGVTNCTYSTCFRSTPHCPYPSPPRPLALSLCTSRPWFLFAGKCATCEMTNIQKEYNFILNGMMHRARIRWIPEQRTSGRERERVEEAGRGGGGKKTWMSKCLM